MSGNLPVAANLNGIKQKIKEAAEKAGRNPEEVKLIAVSKTKPMDLIQEVFGAGHVDFGENRVQELREKQPQLPQAKWHLIGSLQRNKVKYIAPWIHLIHSVDSERLLSEINKQALKSERVIDCLLQMNISGEENKHGLEVNQVEEMLEKIDEMPGIRIKGLMGMAEFTDDQEVVREQFRNLRLTKEKFSSIQHPRIQLEELSMGMSGDYAIAIEEGSTMVRVGSAIFGARQAH